MKTFDEIYEKLHNENYEDLEILRNKEKRKAKIIILVVIGILLVMPITFLIGFFTNPGILFILFPIFGIATFIFIWVTVITLIIKACTISKKNKPKGYNELYKEKIISGLVTNYDNNLRFTHEKSIPEYLYKQGQFEGYDIYHSDDFISGKIDGTINFQMGDIHTQNESTDSDGNTTYYTVFRGLFSSAELNQNINSTIKIRSDKGFLGKGLNKKDQLQMDSLEFEKNFDIYSSDKILAMRLLTSDIMDYMVKFKTDNKVKFEVTLINKSLYLRIHCQNMFEGSVFKDSLDQETLKKYYKYLDFMCELNKKFYNIISEKDI